MMQADLRLTPKDFDTVDEARRRELLLAMVHVGYDLTSYTPIELKILARCITVTVRDLTALAERVNTRLLELELVEASRMKKEEDES